MNLERNFRKELASQLGRSGMLQKIPMLDLAARNVNLALWRLSGSPAPPPGLFKARTIRRYARQYGLRCFVETGTLRGDTIAAVKRDFEEIYSIELSKELYSAAQIRFAGDRHVKLIHGDSGAELPRLIEHLTHTAVFWLDAHYSGGETARGFCDTPVTEEIMCVLRDPRAHVILVDDMRLFGTDPAYPTWEALASQIKQLAEDRTCLDLRNDILRITPR